MWAWREQVGGWFVDTCVVCSACGVLCAWCVVCMVCCVCGVRSASVKGQVPRGQDFPSMKRACKLELIFKRNLPGLFSLCASAPCLNWVGAEWD